MENTSPSAADTVTITTTLTYQPERIPPGCRKPRPVEETIVMQTKIPSVTAGQAPAAATFPSDGRIPHGFNHPEEGIRFFDGGLYCSAGAALTPEYTTRTDHTWESDKAEAEQYVTEQFEGLLIIDGIIWQRINEPYYEVRQYGMGSNHGGTGISLVFPYREVEPAAHVFTVTEPEAAIEAALEVAAYRGDTRSFESIRAFDRLNILIPEAFKILPQAARAAGKEAEARTIADKVAELLNGSFDREMLREARDLLRELDNIMLTQGIETVGEQP